MLCKWWLFLSTRSHVTANYGEDVRTICPPWRKLCCTDRKRSILSAWGGGKAIERHPPLPLPPFRINPLFFLFIISKDSKAFISPSPWTAKIAGKVPRSYLPPRHGLLPGAWLPRRWSTHAANWSALLWVTIQQKDLGIFYSIDYMKNHYSTLEITVSFLFLSSFLGRRKYSYVFM